MRVATRIAIAGAGGRMGQALVEAVLADPGLILSAALDVPGSPFAAHSRKQQNGAQMRA